MRGIWEYISARANYALSKKQVISLIMLVLLVFHIGLFGFFAFFAVTPMMILNVGCILMYVCCYVQTKRGKGLFLAFNLCYTEIMIHAVVAVLLLGVDSGFTLYIIAMLPLGYFASYNFKTEGKTVNPMFYVIFSVVAFFFARIASSYIEPLYSYGNKTVDRTIYMVNYVIAVVAIVVFFSTLLNQIRYLENLHRNQNRKLEQLSKTDELTGLANRRSIQERYEHSEETKEAYALILGDIDDFKKVNDTYGHDIGDVVLKAVAEVFKNAVRGEDTVCRWGGEEILIFLPGCPLHNAQYRAHEILRNIRDICFEAPDHEAFHVTMTLGVAVSTEAADFMEIVKKADDRLYIGKRSGKNKVVWD